MHMNIQTLMLILFCCHAQATVTIENQSSVPVRVTHVTLVQTEGIDQLPVLQQKNITISAGQTITDAQLTDEQHAPISQLTININGISYQFAFSTSAEHSSIRITPELTFNLEGPVQRVRSNTMRTPKLPEGVYAV